MERWGLEETYAQYVASLYADGPDWERFVEAARSLVGEARRHGVPVTVVIFPLFHDLERDPFRGELDRAAAVFRNAGADFLLSRQGGPCGASAAARSEDGVDEGGEGALGGEHHQESEEK